MATNTLTLVVMAAGASERYGGLKQLETFPPNRWTLADYAVQDALAAGFDSVVVVVRESARVYFERCLKRFGLDLTHGRCITQDITYVHKESGHVPINRFKPWGTGHALWCAKPFLSGPFVVINADDFYGAESYRQAAQFLRQEKEAFGMVGYPLGNTLSPFGGVSRSVCSVNPKGHLLDLKEYRSIRQDPQQTGICRTEEGQILKGNETVSVNFWALRPSFLETLEDQWKAFFENHWMSPTEEFYLPEAVLKGARQLGVPIHVLNSHASWMGITYPSDKEWVEQRLQALHSM
jgi:NDP-sugar pyrophosphorylase family protein